MREDNTCKVSVKQCQFTVEGGGWVEQGSNRIENKEDDLVCNRLKVKHEEWFSLSLLVGFLFHTHNIKPLIVLFNGGL